MQTILIVEDDADNRQILIDLLDHAGYEVMATEDPIEAFGLWKKHHPALMLVDIKLDWVSGLELSMWVKQLDPNMPIIAVTGFAMTGDATKILELCDDYVSKPYSTNSILEAVRKWLPAAR